LINHLGEGWDGRRDGIPRRPGAAAKGKLVGEVDAVLKGGDGEADELHGIKAKLLRGLSWSEKERGELTTAW
jgi:hypothetical protein